MLPSPGEYSQEISSSPLIDGSAFAKLEPRASESSFKVNREHAFFVTSNAPELRELELFASVNLLNESFDWAAIPFGGRFAEVCLNPKIREPTAIKTTARIEPQRARNGCDRPEAEPASICAD